MSQSSTNDTTPIRQNLFTASAAQSARPSPEAQAAFDQLLTIVSGQADGIHVAPPDPDAELIRLCAVLDALEWQIRTAFELVKSDQGWDKASGLANDLAVQQRALLDQICKLMPSTLEGYAALAGSLRTVNPDFADTDRQQEPMDVRLSKKLVQALLARPT